MSQVCVIRCHYYRDTRVQREVTALLERGHSVDVLCLRETGEPLRERRERLTIRRVPLHHLASAGTSRRLAEYLAFFVVASLLVAALHLRRRFDLVQVHSVPDALVFVALFPRLTGARVLLDLQEPMPEFFMTKMSVGERHWAVRLIAALETASIRFADAVITATEPMRQTFIARGACAAKVSVVMDGSDETVFDPNRVARHANNDVKFVLVSHGSIEPQYGLDTVIRAVASLTATIPSIELRIVGDGSQRAELQRLAASLGVVDHVVFSAGFVPIDELVTILAHSDVGVVAMRQDKFRDLTLAGKMFDFIAMGVPMVVSTTRSVQETFPTGCFEPFASGDPRDLARAVQRLHADRELAASYAKRATEVARPYSWRAQRERYWRVVAAQLDSVPAYDSADARAQLTVSVTRQPAVSTLGAWDELVRGVPGSDVAQLSHWAEIRRAAGFEPLHVFLRRDTELVGGALVLTRKVPLLGEIGYVPYGPVIRVGMEGDEESAVLAAALRRVARQDLKALFIQPALDDDGISHHLQRNGFRRSDANIAPAGSLRLDLSQDEETLRAGLHTRLRRWTRRWPERGVRVRRGTHDDVALLARLHSESAQHQGSEPIPYEYVSRLYRRLAPAGHAELFVGEVDGAAVAARLFTACGGVLKERLVGMDRDSAAAHLSVPAAVEWEAIRWAKTAGYRWVDFGGISEAAISVLEGDESGLSTLTNVEAFKASFGGTPFRYPIPIEMISSPWLRVAYDIVFRWPAGRRKVDKITHRLLRAVRPAVARGDDRGHVRGRAKPEDVTTKPVVEGGVRHPRSPTVTGQSGSTALAGAADAVEQPTDSDVTHLCREALT